MRHSSKKMKRFALWGLLLILFTVSDTYGATTKSQASKSAPKQNSQQSRKPAQQCQAVKWPFAVSETNFTPQAFDQVERSSLFAYLYFELGAAKGSRTPKLAERLFFYLINTEANEAKAKLLEGIQSVADLNSTTPNIVSIEELCSFEARLPNSTRVKGKKK